MLVGGKQDTAVLESDLAVSYKVKYTSTLRSSHSTPRYLSTQEKRKYMSLQRLGQKYSRQLYL